MMRLRSATLLLIIPVLSGLGFGRQPSVVEADPFLAFSTEDIEGMDKEVR
jgi:hypothetical protein